MRSARRIGGPLVVTALLAGCGSYTKNDFIPRANAICTSAVRQTRSIPPPSSTQGGAGQLRALGSYVDAALPILQSEATQLRAVRRPSQSVGDRLTLERYLAAFTQAVDDYRAIATAAKRGDATGVASAESALRTSPVSSLAAGYGLAACATPGATTVQPSAAELYQRAHARGAAGASSSK